MDKAVTMIQISIHVRVTFYRAEKFTVNVELMYSHFNLLIAKPFVPGLIQGLVTDTIFLPHIWKESENKRKLLWKDYEWQGSEQWYEDMQYHVIQCRTLPNIRILWEGGGGGTAVPVWQISQVVKTGMCISVSRALVVGVLRPVSQQG